MEIFLRRMFSININYISNTFVFRLGQQHFLLGTKKIQPFQYFQFHDLLLCRYESSDRPFVGEFLSSLIECNFLVDNGNK